MDDLILSKTGFRRHVLWVVPTLFIVFIGWATMKSSDISDVAIAYSDPALYGGAIYNANSDSIVLQKIGLIEPVDKLAILEGNIKYSDNKNAVELTVRVVGAKGRAKMDVLAQKINGKWQYDLVRLRIKNPEETIAVVK